MPINLSPPPPPAPPPPPRSLGAARELISPRKESTFSSFASFKCSLENWDEGRFQTKLPGPEIYNIDACIGIFQNQKPPPPPNKKCT